MASFLADLRRRNVIKVGVAYVVTGWILIEAADLLLENVGAPGWVVNAFTVFVFLGFPLALIFAWAFELTPDGLRRTRDLPADYVAPSGAGQRLNYAIIGLLAVALAYFMATHDWSGEPGTDRGGPVKSIVVLPFVNMSGDPDNEYFSDGMTEELLNLLARVDGLRVTSRTSAFAFKGRADVDIGTIAERLNVDHVVEGSVRRADNRLRVTAQLIDVDSDSHLWSQTYDRELDDVFAVQSDISASIAEALEVQLTGESGSPHRPTDNLDAYQLYLRGRYLWQRRGADNLRRAEELFRQAIDLEPEFAKAWAGLAAVYNVISSYTPLTQREMDPKVQAEVQRALELDPDLPDALAVEALFNTGRYRWSEAERGFRRAIRMDPGNSNTRMWYALQLVDTGRTSDAFEFLLDAKERDPLNALVAHWLSDVYRNRNELAASRTEALRSVELGFRGGAMGAYLADLRRGNIEEAIAHLEQTLPAFGVDGSFASEWVPAVATGENTGVTVRRANELQMPAWIYFDTGDPDIVFDRLETDIDTGEVLSAMYRLWEPWHTNIRQHDRFQDLVARLNLVEYWNEFGWPDLCQPAAEGVVCR